MSTFNNIEKELILKALANRRANSQGEFNKKHLIELEKIECELKFEYSHLTPKNKSILIGCLRETYIYPNKYILNLSEYQLTFMRDELLSTFDKQYKQVIFWRKKGACGCSEQGPTIIFIFF